MTHIQTRPDLMVALVYVSWPYEGHMSYQFTGLLCTWYKEGNPLCNATEIMVEMDAACFNTKTCPSHTKYLTCKISWSKAITGNFSHFSTSK